MYCLVSDCWLYFLQTWYFSPVLGRVTLWYTGCTCRLNMMLRALRPQRCFKVTSLWRRDCSADPLAQQFQVFVNSFIATTTNNRGEGSRGSWVACGFGFWGFASFSLPPSSLSLPLLHKVQVDLWLEESRVRILLHEAVDPRLRRVEAASRGLSQAVHDSLAGFRVQVNLQEGNWEFLSESEKTPLQRT